MGANNSSEADDGSGNRGEPNLIAAGQKLTAGQTDYEEGVVKTGIACDRVRQMAKRCIKGSECVQVKRIKAQECIDTRDLPVECLQLMYALSECRRNAIDPRARFRGRKGDM